MSRKRKGKGTAARRRGNFQPGQSGVCEAFLFEFSDEQFVPEGPAGKTTTIDLSYRIAAGSMLEAVQYLAKCEPDFRVCSARMTAMVVLLSGSPYE